MHNNSTIQNRTAITASKLSIAALFLVIFCTVALLVSPPAQAHNGATGIIKERMDLMDKLKVAMKSLATIYRGDQAYDAQQVREAATIIEQHSAATMARLFPEGSLQQPSTAKANIWQQWDDFSHLAERQKLISQGLFSAADNIPQQQNNQLSNMMGTPSPSMTSSSQLMGVAEDTTENYATMPSNLVFKQLTDNCSSCHSRFRAKN
ncbi:MAG: cytochrome c [Pseudomonadales bacterium]|nr:cytochrome c [Pseudomonadales bacterium]NRA14686.1 cytochrome c [Oceanospirillaceae bacterium]